MLELVKTLTITVITKAIQQIGTTQEGKAPIKAAQQLKQITEATTHILHQKPTTEATNQILGPDQIVTIDHPQEEIIEAQNQEDKNDKKNFRNCYSNQHNT
jgi:hypothetical protein